MFPVADEDVKVTEPPAQNVVGPPAVIVGTGGSGFTVTTVGAEVAEHVPFETVTVYEPAVETVMDCVVAPVDQVFPVAADEVRVTEPPVQKAVGPLAVIVGVGGSGLTVITTAEEVEVQEPFETETVYEPLVVTAIDEVVAPVDQVFPLGDEDVKVMDPPAQNEFGPLLVMVGTGGMGFTVTVVAADVEEQDPLETVTV